MELLTVKETAEMLRVSTVTVRRYIASGKLAAVRVGRNIRIRREDVSEFVTPEHSGIDPRFVGKSEEWLLENHPLLQLIGLVKDDGPTDMAENHDKYLAEVYADTHEEEEVGQNKHVAETRAQYVETDKPSNTLKGDVWTGEGEDPARYLMEHYAPERQGKLSNRSKFADKSDEWLLKHHPMWELFGILNEDDGITDLAENHDAYLAEAYEDMHEE